MTRATRAAAVGALAAALAGAGAATARADDELGARIDRAVQRATAGGFWGAVLVARFLGPGLPNYERAELVAPDGSTAALRGRVTLSGDSGSPRLGRRDLAVESRATYRRKAPKIIWSVR